MDTEVLASWLLRRGILTREAVARAQRRRHLYGGALDTILLELGLVEETTLATCLAESTGLEPPAPALIGNPSPDARGLVDLDTARRLGMAPVALNGEKLELVIRLETDLDAVAAWAAARDLGVKCFVVPEVRFEALLAAIYDTTVPPRFAPLLGRLIGAERARRLADAHAKGKSRVVPPPVDTGPPLPRPAPAPGTEPQSDPEIEIVEEELSAPEPSAEQTEPTHDVAQAQGGFQGGFQGGSQDGSQGGSQDGSQEPTERPSALGDVVSSAPPPDPPAAPTEAADDVEAVLTAWKTGEHDDERQRRTLLGRLRRHRADPRVKALVGRWRDQVAVAGEQTPAAITALGEIRDKQAIPLLLEALKLPDRPVAEAAHAALVTITKQDFGLARRRWETWWRQARHKHRVEWLIEALGSKSPELRLAAAAELEELGGQYMGYHFDLGKRDRDEAQRRWTHWWQSTGRAKLGDPESESEGS
jgi:hypothetical protein